MVSVIIATYQNENVIGKIIDNIFLTNTEVLQEVIVVDGNSTDNTAEIAHRHGAKVLINNNNKKASLYNFGAQEATGELLCFITPSCIPDMGLGDIVSYHEQGYIGGNITITTPNSGPYGKLITKLNKGVWVLPNGNSNQCIFITSQAFDLVKGFNESHFIAETVTFHRDKTSPFKWANIIVNLDKTAVNDHHLSIKSTVTSIVILLMCRLNAKATTLFNFYKIFYCSKHFFTFKEKNTNSIAIGDFCHHNNVVSEN